MQYFYDDHANQVLVIKLYICKAIFNIWQAWGAEVLKIHFRFSKSIESFDKNQGRSQDLYVGGPGESQGAKQSLK